MKRRTMIFFSSIRKYRDPARFARMRSVPVPLWAFLTKGSGTLSVDGDARGIETLQPILLLPGVKVRFAADDGELELYLLLLEPVTAAGSYQRRELTDPPDVPAPLLAGDVRLRNREQVLSCIERLYAASRSTPAMKDDGKLQLLFQDLYGAVMQELLNRESDASPDESFRQSVSYLRRHLHERVGLELLADIAGMTPTSYSRKFKKTIGVSPSDYMTRLRLEEAKDRLNREKESVKEIAAQVGFGSEFYFSRVFKQSVGMAPSLYRRRNTLRIAVVACSKYGDILQSIGVAPVAVMNCHRYPGTTREAHSLMVNACLAKLRLVRPELILIDRYHLEYESRLMQVAPTLPIGQHEDWRLVIQSIAEAVGCERSARLLLDRLAGITHEARKRLGSSLGGRSLTLLRITHEAVRIQGLPAHPLNRLLYEELGIAAGRACPEIDRKLELPPERLGEISLRADYLFVHKLQHGTDSDNVLGRLLASPFWQQHESVRARRVRFIPNWHAMSWTPDGRIGIIDTLLELNGKKPL